MRHLILSSILFFVLSVGLSMITVFENNAAAEGLLDGKTFQVKISEYGKDGDPTDDELVFKDGTFFSTDCEQYGFEAAMYEAKSKGGAILFEVSATSKTEGTADWEGKVEGDNISGNFMWTKQGQDPIMYTYTGSLKK